MAMAQTGRVIGVRFWPEPRLLEQALGGDAVAFSEVYRRYAPRVYGFCLARLLSPDAAEDACQETFARLLSADPSSVRALGPWLFGVARHVCADVARRGHGADPLPTEELAAGQEERAAEDIALSRADARRVLLALRRLRPRYRTALVMREVHGLPVREIAEALDVEEGTAHTVLSRARDAFGKAYAEVLDLAPACARAVESIYRQTGTGLSAVERAELDAHLSTCAACRKEKRRAGERVRYAGLLPLLSAPRTGPIAQALARFATRPAPLDSLGPAAVAGGASIAKTGVTLLVSGALVSIAAFSGPAIVGHMAVRQTDRSSVDITSRDRRGAAIDPSDEDVTEQGVAAPGTDLGSATTSATAEPLRARVQSGSNGTLSGGAGAGPRSSISGTGQFGTGAEGGQRRAGTTGTGSRAEPPYRSEEATRADRPSGAGGQDGGGSGSGQDQQGPAGPTVPRTGSPR